MLDDAELGASIAVNGCCLTVVELHDDGGPPTRSPRPSTARRSARCSAGDPVNLERPVRLADRLGGHVVQGHVDARRHRARPHAAARRLDPHDLRRAPPDVLRYVVEKGSITVDGVSLTVAALDDDARSTIAVIPHTLAVTTLGTRQPGDPVNLEVDVLAKYVERLLSRSSPSDVGAESCPSPTSRTPSPPSPAVSSSIVVDDADRENEGDLIMAAEAMTPEAMAFMIRHTSGVICMPVEGRRLDELRLPLMVADNTESQRTAFTVSVDARHGTSTGISAADRVHHGARASSTTRPGPRTSPAPATSSRCATARAAC